MTQTELLVKLWHMTQTELLLKLWHMTQTELLLKQWHMTQTELLLKLWHMTQIVTQLNCDLLLKVWLYKSWCMAYAVMHSSN